VWLKPDREADPKYWPHDSCYLDPTQVLTVVQEPRPTTWATSIVRLRGLIVPVYVLGDLEQVFWLMDLYDPLTVPTRLEVFADPGYVHR
jgi:hypothetical protein